MNFSIIIATRNRRETITRLLLSLAGLDYDPQNYEIVVVDNGSSDQTFGALKEMRKTVGNLTVCRESRIGVSFARNTAVAHAKFDHLIFMDDDIEVKKSLLRSYRRAWEKYPAAGALGGKIRASLPDGKLSPKQKTFIARHDFCFSHLDKGGKDRPLAFGELLFAPNMSYKRLGNEMHIFDTRLGRWIFNDYCLRGEEYELCKRLMLRGKTVMYVADPDMEVVHRIFPNQFTDDYISRRYYFAGIENCVMDTILKSEFPNLRRPILDWIADGVKRLFSPRLFATVRYCFSKYFLIMKMSYFFNGKYFYPSKPPS